MRNKRYFTTFIIVLLFLSMYVCISTSQASFQKRHLITSQGLIRYDDPESTPSPTDSSVPSQDSNSKSPSIPTSELQITGENLGKIPEDWHVGQETSILDSVVLSPSGNPTIRFGGVPRASDSNEVNTDWIGVDIGDTVVFSVWIKSEAEGMLHDGMLGIGCDLYHNSQRLWAVYDIPNFDNEMWKMPTWVGGDRANEVNYVDNGVDSWIKQEWSFIVPDITFTHEDWNVKLSKPVKANGFIAWLTPGKNGDTNDTWFGDAEIYVIKA